MSPDKDETQVQVLFLWLSDAHLTKYLLSSCFVLFFIKWLKKKKKRFNLQEMLLGL